ncbi:MAG: (5-formylfuran-3-yl)methyl phosphate synthase, partial [Vicinamibacteria bacterium]
MMPPVSGPLPATHLLVSVASADEVAAALEGGAEVVDVKNP